MSATFSVIFKHRGSKDNFESIGLYQNTIASYLSKFLSLQSQFSHDSCSLLKFQIEESFILDEFLLIRFAKFHSGFRFEISYDPQCFCLNSRNLLTSNSVNIYLLTILSIFHDCQSSVNCFMTFLEHF